MTVTSGITRHAPAPATTKSGREMQSFTVAVHCNLHSPRLVLYLHNILYEEAHCKMDSTRMALYLHNVVTQCVKMFIVTCVVQD